MTDKSKELTRRNILGGLVVAGVAGAGVGTGTSALFSDDEQFADNVLSAGRLNLEVEIELLDTSDQFGLVAVDESSLASPGDTIQIDGEESEENSTQVATADLQFVLSDIKPGDWWVWKKCIRVSGNPAYVNQTTDPDAPDPRDMDSDGDTELISNENTNTENGRTEPERSVDDTTGPGSGELGGKIRVRAGDDYGGGDGVGGDGPRGRTNVGTAISLAGDENITFAGETSLNPLDLFFQGTLNHSLWALGADMVETDAAGEPITDADGNFAGIGDPDLGTLGVADWNGLPLTNPISRGDPGSDATTFELNNRYDSDDVNHTAAEPGFGLPQDNQNLTAIGPDGDTTEVCIYEKYFLPREVGNEVQGDSISWQLRIRAEQVRNNDDPFGDALTGGEGRGGDDVSPSITFEDQEPEAPA